MSTELMACAMCGDKRAWPDGFPSSVYAECWRCAWKAHVESEHKPPLRRRWRLRWPVARVLDDGMTGV